MCPESKKKTIIVIDPKRLEMVSVSFTTSFFFSSFISCHSQYSEYNFTRSQLVDNFICESTKCCIDFGVNNKNKIIKHQPIETATSDRVHIHISIYVSEWPHSKGRLCSTKLTDIRMERFFFHFQVHQCYVWSKWNQIKKNLKMYTNDLNSDYKQFQLKQITIIHSNFDNGESASMNSKKFHFESLGTIY